MFDPDAPQVGDYYIECWGKRESRLGTEYPFAPARLRMSDPDELRSLDWATFGPALFVQAAVEPYAIRINQFRGEGAPGTIRGWLTVATWTPDGGVVWQTTE